MPNIVYNSVMTEMLEKSPEIKRWRQIAKTMIDFALHKDNT